MNLLKKIVAFLTTIFILAMIILIICIATLAAISQWPIIVLAVCLIYSVNITFSIYIFYSKKRNNVEKKCWMMLLLVLPVIGPLAFIKYGLYPYHKTRSDDLTYYRNILNELDEKLNDGENSDYCLKQNGDLFRHLSTFSMNITKTSLAHGDVEHLKQVESLYAESIKAIRSAKKTILLNFYIINDGIWFRSIINELKKQSDNGIKVYLLFDWIGSKKKYPIKLVKVLAASGIKVSEFKPKKLLYVSGHDNSRSHKKIIIIDNIMCLYGGFNLADEYINYSAKYEYWMDDAFKITGNIIKEYIKSFVCDWMVYSGDKKSKELMQDIKQANLLLSENQNSQGCCIQLFDSNPELVEYKMINFLMLGMTRAKKRIWINTPYLYPTENLMNVIIGLAKANIDIRILVPGLPDNKKFMMWINRSQYEILIKAGVKLYEVNGFLHSKTIIIDDDISLIGTCNLDPRAMNLNYENISLVSSCELNAEIAKHFEENIRKGEQIISANQKQLSFWQQFLVKLLMIWEPVF